MKGTPLSPEEAKSGIRQITRNTRKKYPDYSNDEIRATVKQIMHGYPVALLDTAITEVFDNE